jgi:hypothetical protein
VPPQSSYLGELSRAFWERLTELIGRGLESLHLGREAARWVVIVLVVLALLTIVRIAVSTIDRRRRSRKGQAAEDAISALPLAAAGWDAAAWRREMERCLAEERIGDALQAAWWWLARSIAGPAAEPDWTSRDLQRKTERRELRDLLRRLDALTFAADRPGLADLQHLAERLRSALG